MKSPLEYAPGLGWSNHERKPGGEILGAVAERDRAARPMQDEVGRGGCSRG